MAVDYNSLLVSSFLALLLVTVNPTQAIQQGFTTNLIHRESPQSPYHNPSLTQYQRLRNSLHRSISRISHFETASFTPNDIEPQIRTINNGEYLMEVSFGTPPVSQLCTADTGSDLIWTQCQPCVTCYKQHSPLFDPGKSSTYKLPSCDSNACQKLDRSRKTCTKNNTCRYHYSYGDGSSTFGDISTETITFSSKSGTTSFRDMAIGCGHNNPLGYSSTYRSGIVGLGGGSLSLVSQLGSSIGGKFSYCLIPLNMEGNLTSKIKFGASAEVSGPGVFSTPIVKAIARNSYHLKLEGASVGKVKIPFYNNPSNVDIHKSEGNIIIDSGSTITELPVGMYKKLSSALQKAIQGQKVQDPEKQLDLCYKTSDFGADLNIPNVIFHFMNADLELTYANTFFPISDDIICLYILPSNHRKVFGYLSQMNYLVGYDTVQGKVSFKPTDCTKEH